MTDQQLRRLSRKELLELLLEQSRQMEALQAELDDAKAQLMDRRIALSRAGSIADAAVELNGVFQAAQDAGQQYVDALRDLYQRELLRSQQGSPGGGAGG